MVRLTTSMPTPRPETLVTSAAVEKPGWKRSWNSSWSVELGARRDQAALLGPRADAVAVEAAPVVGDSDEHFGAGMARRQLDPAHVRFCRPPPGVWVLDAVIDGVADEMDQRIGEPLDHGLVEFGLLAVRDEFDLLAEIARQIVHQAAEAAEQRADRHHADAHRGVAQLERPAARFPRRPS